MALADQAAGHPHGFANPLFYSLAGSAAFTDITHPSSTVAVVRANYVNSIDASAGVVYRLRTMDQTLSLNASPGYDDVTGLGTPTSSLRRAPKPCEQPTRHPSQRRPRNNNTSVAPPCHEVIPRSASWTTSRISPKP